MTVFVLNQASAYYIIIMIILYCGRYTTTTAAKARRETRRYSYILYFCLHAREGRGELLATIVILSKVPDDNANGTALVVVKDREGGEFGIIIKIYF